MENTNTNTEVTNTNVENPAGEQGKGQETFTKEEVLKLIQAESDKRVTQALQTAQKKFDRQLSLSKLDENERAAAEKDDKIAELEKQLRKLL